MAAAEIAERAFEMKILRAEYETYCGAILTEKLREGGLGYTEITKIEQGMQDFKSTSLAYDEFGNIIDYDQYYEVARFVERRFGEAIKERISRVHPEYFHVIFYNHALKDGEVCLKVSPVPKK